MGHRRATCRSSSPSSILAAYTYQSGLRAPALIAVVKDAIIYVTVIAAVVVIPAKLGGYGKVFDAVPPQKLILAPAAVHGVRVARPRLGAGALPLSALDDGRAQLERARRHPPQHGDAAGVLVPARRSSRCSGTWRSRRRSTRRRRTRAGFAQYGTNFAVPALFLDAFPSWFAGFSFAAIAIGALVPAAIMSIAAANLFTRNIYKEFVRPGCTPKEESTVAKLASLVVKLGALAFIVLLPAEVRHPAAAARAACGSSRRSRPSCWASTRDGCTAGRCSRGGRRAWAWGRGWRPRWGSRAASIRCTSGSTTLPGYAAL